MGFLRNSLLSPPKQRQQQRAAAGTCWAGHTAQWGLKCPISSSSQPCHVSPWPWGQAGKEQEQAGLPQHLLTSSTCGTRTQQEVARATLRGSPVGLGAVGTVVKSSRAWRHRNSWDSHRPGGGSRQAGSPRSQAGRWGPGDMTGDKP